MTHAKKKDHLAAVSPKPNRMFGSDGCALGVFDLEVASDSIEHGHLSLLDRCGGIVDGERSVFVQHLGIIRSAFNGQIVHPAALSIEIEHGLVAALRPETRRRDVSVERLIQDLLTTIATDKLVTTVLDT